MLLYQGGSGLQGLQLGSGMDSISTAFGYWHIRECRVHWSHGRSPEYFIRLSLQLFHLMYQRFNNAVDNQTHVVATCLRSSGAT